MRSSFRLRRGRLLLGIALLGGVLSVLGACRDGSDSNFSGSIPVVPSLRGTHGCNGPDQTFGMPVVVYSDPSIGPFSQIAAPQDPNVAVTLAILYLTGADGSIRELDFSGGGAPVETVIIGPGVIDGLLAGAGIPQPAQVSGIGILDQANLVVVEQTSNSILLVDLLTPSVFFYAGFPETVGGFSDGFGAQVRYNFTEPAMIVPTSDGAIFVADSGNHALRRLTQLGFPLTETIAGSGAPGHSDGALPSTRFDTPVGVSISCGGDVLVTESGGSGQGGNRLRSIAIGQPGVFGGGFEGDSSTIAGNGTDATVEGGGASAELAAPRGLASTSTGEMYWVDSTTGVLRRYSTMTGQVDCPLFVDCATALMGPTFTNDGGFSVAITEAGILYVLDADAGLLYQITP